MFKVGKWEVNPAAAVRPFKSRPAGYRRVGGFTGLQPLYGGLHIYQWHDPICPMSL